MKTLLKLAQQRCSVPILRHVCVSGGMASAVYMDIKITAPLPNFEEGIWYPYLTDVKVKDEDFKVEDFPALTLGAATGLVTYDRKALLDALAFLTPAMSTDANRYYLNGVCFHDANIVATNGYILKLIDTGVAVPVKMILPRNAVKYLVMLLKEKRDVEKIDLQFHERGFRFAVGDTVLKSKFVDGTYPNYPQTIPKHKKTTDFDLGQISQYKAQIAALKKIDGIKTPPISISDGLLKWERVGPAYGMEFPINLKISEKIGLNYTYLLSMMSGTMSYGGCHEPVKIEDGNKLCVIMLMRV